MDKKNSTLELAEMLLNEKKGPVDTQTLFAKIADIKGYSDEERELNIGQFYTHLTVDGRFVILQDGTWDLRTNHPFEVVNTISTDFELFEEDLIEDEEEDYDSLDVLVVADEEELANEKKSIKTLIGYEEQEEL